MAVSVKKTKIFMLNLAFLLATLINSSRKTQIRAFIADKTPIKLRAESSKYAQFLYKT